VECEENSKHIKFSKYYRFDYQCFTLNFNENQLYSIWFPIWAKVPWNFGKK